jgi:hypothetical protein
MFCVNRPSGKGHSLGRDSFVCPVGNIFCCFENEYLLFIRGHLRPDFRKI